ncbi:MAG: endo alpha-1,4 polygalactosaminidase [Sporomusaceae bacterium]|nr:endo alpha-1,4 polygalactosaminidase [Sporomusaceae bacterium]
MRRLIKEISSYGKTNNKEIEIIVNNGTDLLVAQNGQIRTDIDLMNHIDGLLLESYYYGWEMSTDAETPLDARTQLIEPIALLRAANKAILSIDYCQDIANINHSYTQNRSQRIVSFAANNHQLDGIPTYPPVPYDVNDDHIAFLQQAKNMLVLLNQQQYHDKESYLNALRNTDYDLLIIDAYFNDAQLTTGDVRSLQIKKNGGTRLVFAYMSIGEAEDYRTYWQKAWSKKPPVWLGLQNPDWPGNYKVQYWNKQWKNILFGSSHSYLDGIIGAGFNGVFLDTIDAYQYFLE